MSCAIEELSVVRELCHAHTTV